MTTRHDISQATIYQGDVLDGLAEIPDASVHCVVTSPPYWGLRDYGTATWEGGDAECDHIAKYQTDAPAPFDGGKIAGEDFRYRNICGKCGAIRHDRMIGLEPTLGLWLEKMVAVGREIRRVLRTDGTFWLNVGDAYNGTGAGQGGNAKGGEHGQKHPISKNLDSLKPKDLLLMPARLALALQADGWWLRSDIIWAKPNPMPESVTDRPTSSHEHVYLLTRSARYFYDADAVREANTEGSLERYKVGEQIPKHRKLGGSDRCTPSFLDGQVFQGTGRNLRNVWTMATQPYPEAHFATFPEELPRKCIMAGTSEKGCCPECGAPWGRRSEIPYDKDHPTYNEWCKQNRAGGKYDGHASEDNRGYGGAMSRYYKEVWGTTGSPAKTLGWQPTCACKHHPEPGPMVPYDPIPCTVLDPFAGSGTTLYVARTLGRRAIGIELNPDYIKLALSRLDQQFLF